MAATLEFTYLETELPDEYFCGWPQILDARSSLTQTRRQKQTLHMSVQHILLTLVLRQICNYYSSQNLKVESSGSHVYRFFLQTTWCVAAKLLA